MVKPFKDKSSVEVRGGTREPDPYAETLLPVKVTKD